MNRRTLVARKLAKFFSENGLVPELVSMQDYNRIESKPYKNGRQITRVLGSWSRAMKIISTEMRKMDLNENEDLEDDNNNTGNASENLNSNPETAETSGEGNKSPTKEELLAGFKKEAK